MFRAHGRGHSSDLPDENTSSFLHTVHSIILIKYRTQFAVNNWNAYSFTFQCRTRIFRKLLNIQMYSYFLSSFLPSLLYFPCFCFPFSFHFITSLCSFLLSRNFSVILQKLSVDVNWTSSDCTRKQGVSDEFRRTWARYAKNVPQFQFNVVQAQGSWTSITVYWPEPCWQPTWWHGT